MNMGGPPDAEKRATLRQFAAAGAAVPFLSMGVQGARDDEQDEPDRRAAIHGYVHSHPGIHFSALRDDLELGTGETQYHLRRLREAGAIESERDGEYRRLFLAGRFDEFEKRALGYLRRDTPRGMLVRLLSDPTISPSELAEELDVSRAAISQTAARLDEAGLLSRESGYTPRRPAVMISLLLRYAESFDEETVRFADTASTVLSWDPEQA